MVGVHRLRPEDAWRRACALPARASHRSHAPLRQISAVQTEHRIRQHDLRKPRKGVSGRSHDRTPPRGLHSLERDGDGRAGESSELRIRRSHRELRVCSNAVRSGLQSLLARAYREASRRSRIHPRSRIARHLCARVFGRASHRESLTSFPQGSDRSGQWPELVSASVVDAGFLAVPDRVDGPWAR